MDHRQTITGAPLRNWGLAVVIEKR